MTLLFIGLVFGGIGGYMLWREWKFFKTAIRVPGVVVSYQERRGSKGSMVYAPVVEFEFDGEKRQATSFIYSSGKPQIGKQRIVGVDPYHIENARIYDKGALVLGGLFLLIGLVAIAGAVSQFLY